MDKYVHGRITTILLIIAVTGIGSAMVQSRQKKAIMAENATLQEKLARLEASVTGVGHSSARIVSEGTDDMEALQALIAEKEEELATLKNNRDVVSTNAPPAKRESWEDRMARMKTEDPEGYAEMIQRREERQQEMRYNLAERTATFMDLDTSRMNDNERANHELLVEKMSRIWELSEQFQNPEAAPNREAMRELSDVMREARPLMDMERTVMFKQLGLDVGYEGADAKAFADHVENIIESTSLRIPRGGGRGRDGR